MYFCTRASSDGKAETPAISSNCLSTRGDEAHQEEGKFDRSTSWKAEIQSAAGKFGPGLLKLWTTWSDSGVNSLSFTVVEKKVLDELRSMPEHHATSCSTAMAAEIVAAWRCCSCVRSTESASVNWRADAVSRASPLARSAWSAARSSESSSSERPRRSVMGSGRSRYWVMSLRIALGTRERWWPKVAESTRAGIPYKESSSMSQCEYCGPAHAIMTLGPSPNEACAAS
mmetsp:Transcript_35515/g.75738  ORF Transcript_35515/g.75738 Transcript_35515/m.75738 type:complete len:229 (+) Transcript_35515:748-1434(+)